MPPKDPLLSHFHTPLGNGESQQHFFPSFYKDTCHFPCSYHAQCQPPELGQEAGVPKGHAEGMARACSLPLSDLHGMPLS